MIHQLSIGSNLIGVVVVVFAEFGARIINTFSFEILDQVLNIWSGTSLVFKSVVCSLMCVCSKQDIISKLGVFHKDRRIIFNHLQSLLLVKYLLVFIEPILVIL
jgi:hypothetical protein